LIFLLSHISGSTTTKSTPTHPTQQTQSTIQDQTFTSTHISLPKSQIGYNELNVEKKIGKGSYGKVCVGNWNGTRVAIKFCRNKTKLDEFMHEVRLIMYMCEY
jgi:predicted Ser/Thr protein kinase